MISPTATAAFFFGFDGSAGVVLREAGLWLYPESVTEDLLSTALHDLLVDQPQAAMALLNGRVDDLDADLVAHLANVANPHSVTKAQVGLANVDNTSDMDKPVSTATDDLIDSVATFFNDSLTTHANLTATHGASGAVVGTNNTQTLSGKTLASPAFTGTPTGLTKAHVGLGNVDNTSDVNKPVSTATNTALSGKANTSHVHSGADITSGTVPIGQLPTGATSTTLATGNRGLPTGGATGSQLTKNSGTNYDVSWVAKPVTPAPVHTANATAAVYSSAGTVTLATSTITLPVGVWLVRGDGWFHGEGTSGTTGGFTLGMSVNGSVQTSQNQLFEQGVDDMYHFANAALVTGTGAAITVTFQMAWVSGNVQRYNAELMITATPA